MKAQPEALRLADELEDSLYSADGTSLSRYCQGIADEAAAEMRRLYAEAEAFKADAARYRAIRKGLEIDPDNSGIVVSLIDDFGGQTLQDEIADAAIDAAIAKATGGAA